MWVLMLLAACDATVRHDVIGAGSEDLGDGCSELWFSDGDGDGYGAGEGQAACEAPEGWVANTDDCDDSDDAVHPDAMEICEDGLDNNCDGTARGCTPQGIRSLTEDELVVVGESEEDDLGEVITIAGDLDGDGFDDLAVGAPYAQSAAGHAAVLLGPIHRPTGLRSADRVWPGASQGDYLGDTVIGAGDLDGDGYLDLAVGAKGDDSIDNGTGAVYLIHGPGLDKELSRATGVLLGTDAGEEAGDGLHAAGDVDGDGLDDLLIGAPGHHAVGRVYLVHGPVTATFNLAVADAVFDGQATSDDAGETLATGDLDGDGRRDFAIGAPGADGLAQEGGMVYLVFGPVTGDVSLDLADGRVWGSAYENVGDSLAIPGDLDGDGVDELVVGSTWASDGGHDEQGRAFVFLDTFWGTVDIDSAEVVLTGEESYDRFATSIAGAGDVDGDGLTDLVVGAPYNDFGGTDAGAGYLFYGPLLESRIATTADAKFSGPEANMRTGAGIGGAGDLDGDGLDDLVLGASGLREGGTTMGGVYQVLSGDRL